MIAIGDYTTCFFIGIMISHRETVFNELVYHEMGKRCIFNDLKLRLLWGNSDHWICFDISTRKVGWSKSKKKINIQFYPLAAIHVIIMIYSRMSVQPYSYIMSYISFIIGTGTYMYELSESQKSTFFYPSPPEDGEYWPIRPLSTVTVWVALDRCHGCVPSRSGLWIVTSSEGWYMLIHVMAWESYWITWITSSWPVFKWIFFKSTDCNRSFSVAVSRQCCWTHVKTSSNRLQVR